MPSTRRRVPSWSRSRRSRRRARQGKIGNTTYKVTPTSDGGYVLAAVGADGSSVRRGKAVTKTVTYSFGDAVVTYVPSKEQASSDGTRNRWIGASSFGRDSGNPAVARRKVIAARNAAKAAEAADAALWPDGKARLDLR